MNKYSAVTTFCHDAHSKTPEEKSLTWLMDSGRGLCSIGKEREKIKCYLVASSVLLRLGTLLEMFKVAGVFVMAYILAGNIECNKFCQVKDSFRTPDRQAKIRWKTLVSMSVCLVVKYL